MSSLYLITLISFKRTIMEATPIQILTNHYQITPSLIAADDESDDEEGLTNGYESHHRGLPNGIVSVVLNNDDGGLEEERPQSDCKEKERRREEEIQRAFNEDETRRNASLTMENAARVKEAMCGVLFSGFAPDWAQSVPEDNWTDGLRRLRRTMANSSASTSVQN